MPTRNFATSALQGAAPGLSRLAMALGGGQQAFQQGQQAEELNQSRIAQALSQINAHNAQADKYSADAAQQRAETAALARRPDQQQELAAYASGSSLPLVRAVMEASRTGQPATFDDVGPTPDGGNLQSPVPADVQTKIGQALLRLAPVALNSKDFKIDDWAQAQGAYRNQDLGDDVLAGRRTAGDVGRSQAAVAAKPLYNAEANGSVLDLFGGSLDTDNPMAQGSIRLKGDQGAAQRANAAQSYAAARNSDAHARKADAEARDGVNRGGAKAPAGYRWTADGLGLESIPGGPADPNTKGAKQAKPPTEGQSKALLFGSRMAISDEILNELADKGVRTPSLLKQGAEGIPLIGNAASAGLNFIASPQQQQVEQAQRDFINAVLRRESGAAISEGEFANARRQYFAAPGDSPQVLRQKAANRLAAIKGFQAELGDALAPNFDSIVGGARAARRGPGSGRASDAGSPANRTVEVDF
jgi:hypothetical protein